MKLVYDLLVGALLNELYAHIPRFCIAVSRWRVARIKDEETRTEANEAFDAFAADVLFEESRLQVLLLTAQFLMQDWRNDFPELASDEENQAAEDDDQEKL